MPCQVPFARWCLDGTGLSFAAVQGILAGCIVGLITCLAVTALLVYLCTRRAARLRRAAAASGTPKTPDSLTAKPPKNKKGLPSAAAAKPASSGSAKAGRPV
ncbi:hypothetical protein WJX81_002307 [Elliptochloris bilobata]|uniref:Uncharacterized protein n=1 Tax=Elliptochloris bilobata TaxID=381761 RepID=A0AAW1QN17_9CHLO